jgi:hypothetical protein
MGKLIYSILTSLDGYTEDEQGHFGWGAPEGEEVHSYINALASSVGTYLYGRRMYGRWFTRKPRRASQISRSSCLIGHGSGWRLRRPFTQELSPSCVAPGRALRNGSRTSRCKRGRIAGF